MKVVKTTTTAQIQKAQQLLLQGDKLEAAHLDQNSKVNYLSDIKVFNQYCEDYALQALPASTATIKAYIAHRKNNGIKYSTIKRNVLGIRKWHLLKGEADPITEKIKNTLKGLRKTLRSDSNNKQLTAAQKRQALKQITNKKAAALSFQKLEEALQAVDEISEKQPIKCIRDKAILSLLFWGAFRRSELASLQVLDVARIFDNSGVHSHYTITLRDAKNLEDDNDTKVIPYQSNVAICPARKLKQWLDLSGYGTILANYEAAQELLEEAKTTEAKKAAQQLLNMAELNDTFLFPSMRKGDKLQEGKPITGKTVDRLVKKYAGAGFSGHSGRVGFITESKRQGLTDSQIMNQSLHKVARSVRRYDESKNDIKQNAAALLNA